MHDFAGDVDEFLDVFGEPVVIVEKGKADRTVLAIVDRQTGSIGRDGTKLDARAVLELANHPVKGIPSTCKLGEVSVRMAIRQGGPLQDWPIAMSDDPDGWADEGMVRVKIR